MAFKKLINNKILSLFGVLMLSGTSMVMAADATTAAAPGSDSAPSVWTGVSYYVLLFLVVCFAVGIIGKILQVYDLTLKLQRKPGIKWNNVMGVLCIAFLVVGLVGVYWSFTVQGSMILPEAASLHGKTIDTMFWTTFGITVVVFIGTQILLFTFAFIYRGSDKRRAYYLPHNNTIEKIWTVAPAIVLTVLVIFGFFTWRSITNTVDAKGEPASINIDLTGHQFAWEVRYPGKDGKLGMKNYKLVSGTNKVGLDFKDRNSLDDINADTIVLPVNKSIRLNIIAQDVIHSVYMPNFRLQMNAVPGLPTFFKFTPTITTADMRNRLDKSDFEYHLYCNKICGGGHYNMQKIVRVVTEAEYQDWLSHQKPYLNDALKKELKMADATQPQQSGVQNRLAFNN
ncbi:cytochrome c oxidase subunit II [Mucilaginibacter jinjuensis]|uniref:Cytochrome c oxidase subunit 2 n=1 Tax=Mucilaginibacter jinjuensis TaxID=1176721 RepID=A0ABY7TB62_9SPHI|nr:cytochrome c oxidase subunit II [Mucilaginibacter jinjuensis]WCT12912.1 cytochrome c oxidase subunit II [Mucilaginibacter jinjuensis]